MAIGSEIEWMDLVTLGGVVVTCVWSVAKINTTINSVRGTAEKTAALLGKDIQHLSLAISEFKTELLSVKKEQLGIDRRVARLEVLNGSSKCD